MMTLQYLLRKVQCLGSAKKVLGSCLTEMPNLIQDSRDPTVVKYKSDTEGVQYKTKR